MFDAETHLGDGLMSTTFFYWQPLLEHSLQHLCWQYSSQERFMEILTTLA